MNDCSEQTREKKMHVNDENERQNDAELIVCAFTGPSVRLDVRDKWVSEDGSNIEMTNQLLKRYRDNTHQNNLRKKCHKSKLQMQANGERQLKSAHFMPKTFP